MDRLGPSPCAAKEVITVQQLLGSLAFGLLIGSLVGLSASPVVGAVLVPLMALVQCLTLRSRKDEGREIKVELGILGIFSIACLVAMLAGTWVRAHRMLGPSIDQTIERLKREKCPQERIWDFVIQESSTFPMSPNVEITEPVAMSQNVETTESPKAAPAVRSPYIASLHAGETRPASLDPTLYDNLNELLTEWELVQQPFWEQFAREARTVYERCPSAEEPLRAVLNHVYQNTGE